MLPGGWPGGPPALITEVAILLLGLVLAFNIFDVSGRLARVGRKDAAPDSSARSLRVIRIIGAAVTFVVLVVMIG